MIQRNGRTGRKRDGRVVTLISEGAEAKRYQASMTDQKRVSSRELRYVIFLSFLCAANR